MNKNFLLKYKILFKIYLFYYALKYKFFINKKTYSQFGEDLVISNFFGNFVGKYVDIGCYHPVKYSNTALLHKKNWSGVNIDLSETSIQLFNYCRKKDLNIKACISDKKENISLYLVSDLSPLNSVHTENIEKFKLTNFKKVYIETQVFSELVLDNFDFLNIDCEGSDYKIIKSIDLKKYTPKIICIEIHSKNQELIYNYLQSFDYELFEKKDVSHIFKKI